MFRNVKLRKSFTLIMLLVYLVSLPIIIVISYQILLKNAEKESIERAQMMLRTMDAIKEYVGGTIRPVLEELTDKEPVELTSGFYVIREISDIITESDRQYSFKFASINPLNQVNRANQFETEKINEFRMGKIKGQWRGFIETPQGSSYVIMTPIVVDAHCLRCHGDPNMATEDQKKRYGTESGYNWKEGEIIGANTVYVPANVPIQNARRALILFSIVYSLLFLVVILVIDRLIKASIIKPIEELVQTADEISRGNFERDFEVKARNEIKTLADAFTRMKLSLMKAMDILRKK
jgi:HAMP domain-containing protein